ncbi:MAG: hypothetical protein QOH03_4536, partial [Kribbellaceae bacterium]|nr:hypothetical protein [Kribbellaceae bacterium]
MRPALTAALAVLLLTPLATLATAQASDPPTSPTVVPLGVPLSDVLLIGGTVAPGPDAGKAAIWNVSTATPAYLNAVDPATGASLISAALPGASGS